MGKTVYVLRASEDDIVAVLSDPEMARVFFPPRVILEKDTTYPLPLFTPRRRKVRRAYDWRDGEFVQVSGPRSGDFLMCAPMLDAFPVL